MPWELGFLAALTASCSPTRPQVSPQLLWGPAAGVAQGIAPRAARERPLSPAFSRVQCSCQHVARGRLRGMGFLPKVGLCHTVGQPSAAGVRPDPPSLSKGQKTELRAHLRCRCRLRPGQQQGRLSRPLQVGAGGSGRLHAGPGQMGSFRLAFSRVQGQRKEQNCFLLQSQERLQGVSFGPASLPEPVLPASEPYTPVGWVGAPHTPRTSGLTEGKEDSFPGEEAGKRTHTEVPSFFSPRRFSFSW